MFAKPHLQWQPPKLLFHGDPRTQIRTFTLATNLFGASLEQILFVFNLYGITWTLCSVFGAAFSNKILIPGSDVDDYKIFVVVFLHQHWEQKKKKKGNPPPPRSQKNETTKKDDNDG
jgi:hypothetical protein